jgi:hypothetical protein
MSFISGLDLGQSNDYSALVVCEQVEGPDPVDAGLDRAFGFLPKDLTRHSHRQRRPRVCWHYAVRHLHRYALGTSYSCSDPTNPGVAEQVSALFAQPPLPGSTLVVDQTGVGRAVVDLVRSLRPPVILRALTITAGEHAHREGLDFHAPKRELVGTLQKLLQTGRLRISSELKLAPLLVAELQAFRVKQKTSGHESFEAWREQDHDDLLLALALACWVGEQVPPLRRGDLGTQRRHVAALPAGVFETAGLPRRW